MATKQETPAKVADYQLLLKPVITEKSSMVGGDGSCIVFDVAPKASKTEIKEAVERIFSVRVRSVRTINVLGKLKRTNRSIGRRKSSKKAYVTLHEGESIDIVEGV